MFWVYAIKSQNSDRTYVGQTKSQRMGIGKGSRGEIEVRDRGAEVGRSEDGEGKIDEVKMDDGREDDK